MTRHEQKQTRETNTSGSVLRPLFSSLPSVQRPCGQLETCRAVVGCPDEGGLSDGVTNYHPGQLFLVFARISHPIPNNEVKRLTTNLTADSTANKREP
jgi:hypothetical protein